jgi:hypothetical protein
MICSKLGFMRLASGIAQGTTVAVTARLANAMPVRLGRQPLRSRTFIAITQSFS